MNSSLVLGSEFFYFPIFFTYFNHMPTSFSGIFVKRFFVKLLLGIVLKMAVFFSVRFFFHRDYF